MKQKSKKEFPKIISEEIKSLLRKKVRSDKNKQKGIRHKIRKLLFYISDFRKTRRGFTAKDFDKLMEDKEIKIIK